MRPEFSHKPKPEQVKNLLCAALACRAFPKFLDLDMDLNNPIVENLRQADSRHPRRRWSGAALDVEAMRLKLDRVREL